MSKKNAHLPNQTGFPFVFPCLIAGRSYARPNPSPSPSNAVQLAACGLDDGNSNPLARTELASVARIRDTEREAWFVDDDAYNTAIANATALTKANA